MKKEQFRKLTYTSVKHKDKITLFVGDQGTIKKLNGDVMKQNKLRNGYMYVSHPDFRGLLPVHRLVCTAFNDKKITAKNRAKFQAAHLNGDRLDNRASNLVWMTRKQNNEQEHTRKKISKNAKRTDRRDQVIAATKNDEVIYFWSGNSAAEYIQCSHVLVYNVLNPEHWAKTAKGWHLKWVDLKDLLIGITK